MAKWKIISFLFIQKCALLFGQERLHLKHFTTQDGLPSNEIYNILEDQNGFIWIGTELGAARYDGVSFKTYTVDDGLSDNNVLSVIEDYRGRIWFIHFASIPSFYYRGKIYNRENHLFLHLLNLFKFNAPPLFFHDLKQREIYFPIKHHIDSLLLVSIDGHFEKEIIVNTNCDGNKPNFFFRTNDKLNLLVDGGGQSKKKEKSSSFSVSRFFLEKNQEGKNRIYFSNDEIGTSGWFDLLTGKKHERQVLSSIIWNSARSKKTYCVRNSILQIWNNDLDTLMRTFEVPTGLRHILEAQNGQIWMTSPHGLFVATPQFTRSMVQSNLKTSAFYAVFESEGEFYFGSNNHGVYRVKKGNQEIIHSDIPTNRIHGFVKSGQQVYFGSDGGLFEINGNRADLIEKMAIKDIELDLNNNVLISSTSGIYRYKNNQFDALASQRTTCVFPFDDKTTWFGTLDSLNEIVEGKKVIVRKIKTDTPLDNSHVKDIKRDSKGGIWIATHMHGLFYYSENTKFISIGESNTDLPLASRICIKIYIDNLDQVWVATSIGVSKVQYEGNGQFHVENFSESDGVIREDVHDLLLKENQLYLATSNGAVVVDLPKPSQFVSIPIFEKVLLNGNEISTQRNSFHYKENNFHITLAASFSSAVSNKYHFKYRLKGISNQWVDLFSDEIILLNMPPGDYVLTVQPFSFKGMNAKELEWRFTIHKPWFRTIWFYSSISLLVLLLLTYFVIRETNRIKTARNLSRMELKVLRAQMNPHFIFNALNSIQHQLFSRDFKSANAFISRFAKLLRSNLHYSAQEFIDVHEEIAFVTNYMELEKYRFENLFDYEIITENFDESDSFTLPPFLIQPLLENCVKHAFKNMERGGKIELILKKIDEHHLEVLCFDNGKGIPFDFEIKSSEKVGDSVGLGIIAERLKILAAQHKSKKITLSITNRGDDPGTKAQLIIPIICV